MERQSSLPDSFLEAVKYFSNQDNARQFLAALRWPDGPECPVEACRSKNIAFLLTRGLWKCRACKKQFSVKVGTVFEESPIGLDKWLPVVWLIANCKNGISSYEIARDLKVTQKTAWFMLHRVRLAMQTGTFSKLSGEVEVDETFIGGKARNMHAWRRRRDINRDNKGKTVVLGMLERRGEVRAAVLPNRRKESIRPVVGGHIERGSKLYTDEHGWGWVPRDQYELEMVNHLEQYVNGNVHTNTLENFWSLLKRSLGGTYVAVEPFHLFRYVDEQAFRYNYRKLTDFERFQIVTASIIGKRLTYRHLTGKDREPDATIEEPF